VLVQINAVYVHYSSPHCVMITGSRGLLLAPVVVTFSIFLSTSMLPGSSTLPNTVCLPSSHSEYEEEMNKRVHVMHCEQSVYAIVVRPRSLYDKTLSARQISAFVLLRMRRASHRSSTAALAVCEQLVPECT
jgi:hypothetical protein